MQTSRDLIYNDVCTVCLLGMVLYRWNQERMFFWVFLFVYFLVKQIHAHRKYLNLNNRLF